VTSGEAKALIMS